MKTVRCFILFFLSALPSAIFADVNTDLSNFFNGLGFSDNDTAPNVYKGQQAGYYTGGSIFARDSVRDVQIAQIELPQLRSGCGGIDLFSGGFSFINTKALVDNMKNVINNAESFAFNLAIESATPELANAMKYLNTLANDVNRMNINSCETAAGLVGSIWPKTHEAQEQVCQDIGTGSGIFKDYAAARQGCGPGGQLTSTMNRAEGPYKNLALQNSNLAWKALMQNNFLQSDPELAEFFMSLSGTVIISNPGDDDVSEQHYKILPSLAGDQSLLRALLHGDTAKIYVCNDTSSDGCLNPSIQGITISKNNALEAQVAQLLNDMVDKIYANQPLTTEEIGLLNATRLPVYKMLNVQAAFAGDKSVLDIQDYADVIATDILFQYLDESLSVVRTSSATLQYPDSIMSAFMKGIDQARNDVREAEKSAYAQVSMAAQLIAQTQRLEQMLAGSLSAQLNGNLQWAANLRQ